MRPRNVLRVNATEETAAYRDAVAEILRNVQNDYGATLLEISETIDVSLGTVSNAANKKTDLNPIYLKRIGEAFGPNVLDPYARLMGGRFVRVEPDNDSDILPTLLSAGHLIAIARSPGSPGGTREVIQERLGYLPDLRRVMREAEALIAAIENERSAL